MGDEHVLRHKKGVWNGIWTDQFIESIYMRYGHGPGGFNGFTLKPKTLAVWALSLNVFGLLQKDVDCMRELHKLDCFSSQGGGSFTYQG